MQQLRPLFATVVCGALSLASAAACAAGAPDSAALLAAQRQAMQPLGIFDGTWRGPAKLISGDGQALLLTQTERVGSLLGGTVKLIEGRSHAPDGSSPFNALAVISYSPQAGKYNFRSHAQGYSGDFALEVRADGFTWTLPAGPATLRYTATVKDGVWTEIGERLVEGQAPVKTFEMTLQRIGPTDWPAAGAVAPN
jgi:hypothetical protein